MSNISIISSSLVIELVPRFRWFPSQAHLALLAHQEFPGPLDPWWVWTPPVKSRKKLFSSSFVFAVVTLVLTGHNVFQGLHGMPGPKVSLRELFFSMRRRLWYVWCSVCLGSHAGRAWIWDEGRKGRLWCSWTPSKWHRLLLMVIKPDVPERSQWL